MKTTVKHFLTALLLVFTVSLPAAADKDEPITVNELPAKAQTILQTHFKGAKVALAKKETDLIGKSYEVIFTNGDKVEFSQRGEWTDLVCKSTGVPAALVPAHIATYVKTHCQAASVIGLERTDRKGYEVKLSDGRELEFNSKGKLVDIGR